jgi:hypothetical protein
MLNAIILPFIAGFISVLIFHQGVWAAFAAAGKTPFPAWSMTTVPPLGIPQVISAAFWGGIWGILMWALWPILGTSLGYWPYMIGVGAVATSAVALMVVGPLKGRPFAAGWSPAIWIFALLVNAAWGLGLGLLLRLFGVA